ncbi:MAG: hypothetical protein D6689_04510, partial [Deltaproteobacteria bacterium]
AADLAAARDDAAARAAESAALTARAAAAPAIELVVDSGGTILAANVAAERALGYPRGGLVGQPFEPLFADPAAVAPAIGDGADPAARFAALRDALADGAARSVVLLSRRGADVPVLLAAARGDGAAAGELVVTALDRTAGAQAERDRDRLARALDEVTVGVGLLALNGVLSWANRALFADLGHETDCRRGCTRLSDLLRVHDGAAADWLDVTLESLSDGMLDIDLAIDQLPQRIDVGDATFALRYAPIYDPDEPDSVDKLLVTTTNVTEQIAAERGRARQEELLAAFQVLLKDRDGFEEFLDECDRLVDLLASGASFGLEKRALHTLKGNCAINGLRRFAALCHELETAIVDRREPMADGERRRLVAAWADATLELRHLLERRGDDVVAVPVAEHAALVARVEAGAPAAEIAGVLRDWTRARLAQAFERLERQAIAIGQRLGKPVDVVRDDGGLRYDGKRLAPLWASAVHLLRNAIDHGIEPPDARRAAGKPERGRIDLTARCDGDALVVTIADDGRGIDWQRVADKARAAGLPCSTRAELERALFATGLTTRDTVSDVSGRGVGLSAVRDEVAKLGGSIAVDSRPGRGTRFELRVPRAAAGASGPLRLVAAAAQRS